MKAIQYFEFGSPNVLKLVDIEVPAVKEGEVLVRIKAAGVNPVDAKIRKGLLTSRVPSEFPIIPGWDFSGEIVARGFAARRFEVGEKVLGYARRPIIHRGTYAEYISIPECYISKAPTSIELSVAAALPLAALTAYQSLFSTAKLRAGETVLILGASGGVGSFAVQLAANAGATVIGIASKENHDYLKQLGAAQAFDYKTTDIAKAVKEQYPQGVDVVFDCIGGDAFTNSFKYINAKGRIVSLIVNIQNKEELPNPLVEYYYHFVEPNSKELDMLCQMVDKQKLTITISKQFKLEEAQKAHEEIEHGHQRGKIILNID